MRSPGLLSSAAAAELFAMLCSWEGLYGLLSGLWLFLHCFFTFNARPVNEEAAAVHTWHTKAEQPKGQPSALPLVSAHLPGPFPPPPLPA